MGAAPVGRACNIQVRSIVRSRILLDRAVDEKRASGNGHAFVSDDRVRRRANRIRRASIRIQLELERTRSAKRLSRKA